MIKRNQIDKINSSSGGGDATAANQVLEITELIAVNNKLLAQATAANQVTEIAELTAINNKLLAQATAANQVTEIAELTAINNKLLAQATAANQTIEIAELTAINNKLLAQATAANQIIINTSLNNILLENTFRFNNGLTSTSFTAGTLVLLNTGIQTFINANPNRRFKTISTTQLGAAFNGILIHSL